MQFNKNTSHILTLWLFFTTFFSLCLQAQQGVKQENQGIVAHIDPPVNSVELLDFTGFYSKTMQQVILSFEIGDKNDYQNFLFERRSALEEKWDILGFIAAKDKASAYDYIDSTPLPNSYYRMRGVDKNGKASSLKIISVSKDDVSKLKVYPKIVKDSLLNITGIEIADDTTQNKAVGSFTVINVLGQLVMQGETKAHINISFLPRGIYALKIGENNVKFLRQ